MSAASASYFWASLIFLRRLFGPYLCPPTTMIWNHFINGLLLSFVVFEPQDGKTFVVKNQLGQALKQSFHMKVKHVLPRRFSGRYLTLCLWYSDPHFSQHPDSIIFLVLSPPFARSWDWRFCFWAWRPRKSVAEPGGCKRTGVTQNGQLVETSNLLGENYASARSTKRVMWVAKPLANCRTSK